MMASLPIDSSWLKQRPAKGRPLFELKDRQRGQRAKRNARRADRLCPRVVRPGGVKLQPFGGLAAEASAARIFLAAAQEMVTSELAAFHPPGIFRIARSAFGKAGRRKTPDRCCSGGLQTPTVSRGNITAVHRANAATNFSLLERARALHRAQAVHQGARRRRGNKRRRRPRCTRHRRNPSRLATPAR